MSVLKTGGDDIKLGMGKNRILSTFQTWTPDRDDDVPNLPRFVAMCLALPCDSSAPAPRIGCGTCKCHLSLSGNYGTLVFSKKFCWRHVSH